MGSEEAHWLGAALPVPGLNGYRPVTAVEQ